MTSSPFTRVKSPSRESITLRLGSVLIASANPVRRSLAGADPVVPSISTMFTGWRVVL